MKKQRFGIFIAVIGLAVGAWVLVAYLQRPKPSFAQTVDFIRALHQSSQAREQGGQLLPVTAQVSQLVSNGYISPKLARGFEGSTVALSSTADESRPQMALIRVQLHDGREIVLLADGSIQQLPK
jgi:hypothetical protein